MNLYVLYTFLATCWFQTFEFSRYTCMHIITHVCCIYTCRWTTTPSLVEGGTIREESKEQGHVLTPLERYFSRQRHRGGSNENPTAYQIPYNAATLVQQRSMYHDLKSMNVKVHQQDDRLHHASRPLNKRPRNIDKLITISYVHNHLLIVLV